MSHQSALQLCVLLVQLNIWTELHCEVEHFDPVLPEEFYGGINQVGSWHEESLFQILKKKKYILQSYTLQFSPAVRIFNSCVFMLIVLV